MWVRGLKHSANGKDPYSNSSHPMWVRGLKHFLYIYIYGFFIVAPYVGAWIETLYI